MNKDDFTQRHRLMSLSVSLAAAALLGGCVTYGQSQLATMSGADICELQYVQGPNLSQESRRAIQSELQRRNDNCRNHAAEVQERFAAFMYRETYGRQDSPP